jgi:hypothetical protein
MAANSPGVSATGTWSITSGITSGMTRCNSICWNGIRFVAVGYNGSGSIGTVFGYSTDGITWTNVGSTSPNITNGKCVVWNGIRFVAGGNFITLGETSKTFAYSKNRHSLHKRQPGKINEENEAIIWLNL